MARKDPKRCHATSKTTGKQCAQRPLMGQRVCHYHGGKAPQAVFSAEKRIAALVAPALHRIGSLIDSGENDNVRLAAAKDILDRAGYKPSSKVEGESTIHIEIVRDDAPAPLILDIPAHYANGHAKPPED